MVSYRHEDTLKLVTPVGIPLANHLLRYQDGEGSPPERIGPLGVTDGSLGPRSSVLWARGASMFWPPAVTVIDSGGRTTTCPVAGSDPVWRSDGRAVVVRTESGFVRVDVDGGCSQVTEPQEALLSWRGDSLVSFECRADCSMLAVRVAGNPVGEVPFGSLVQVERGTAVLTPTNLYIVLDDRVIDEGNIEGELLPFPSHSLEERRSGMCGSRTCWRFSDGRKFAQVGYPLDVDIGVRPGTGGTPGTFFDLDAGKVVAFPDWAGTETRLGRGSNEVLVRADGSIRNLNVGCRDEGRPPYEW